MGGGEGGAMKTPRSLEQSQHGEHRRGSNLCLRGKKRYYTLIVNEVSSITTKIKL